MKKILSLLTAAAVVISAAGCKDSSNNTPTGTSGTSGAPAAAPTATTTTVAFEQTSQAMNPALTETTTLHTTKTMPQYEETTMPPTTTMVEPEATVTMTSIEEPDKPYMYIYAYDGENADGTISPDTKTIKVFGVSEEMRTAIGMGIEKNVQGEWVSICQCEAALGVFFDEEEKEVFSFDTSWFSEPLTYGVYRIVAVMDEFIDCDCVEDCTELKNVKEYGEFWVSGENPPLAEGDIEMKIRYDGEITTATKSIVLEYEYVGNAEYAEYGFGEYYTLEKKIDGKWQEVKFGEQSAFNDLAYLIGSMWRRQSTTVSLLDNFYAEPLTAGTYRVVKPIENGITLYAEFEMYEADGLSEGAPEGYTLVGGNSTITLTINEKTDNAYICSTPWPYPAVYRVDFSDLECCSGFSVGDTIEVAYTSMFENIDDSFDCYIIPYDMWYSDFELQTDVAYKPVIYLYPETETEVDVKLYYDGELTVTYPSYEDGWSVTAKPDGTLYDENGNEYSYLFWEGKSDTEYDLSEGFCVKGGDTVEFLREKLSYLGLTPKEYNEFIVFWLPFMQGNEYNIITFQGDCYTDSAVLDVTPAPDTVLRVFMTFTPSDEYVEIPPQTLAPTVRNGFTVVEWGGTRLG